MMERTTSTDLAVAYALWATVGLLLAASWVASPLAAAPDWVGRQVGYTACIVSAIAAVVHIRYYTIRVCRLIRNLHGVSTADRPAAVTDMPEQRGVFPIR
jgi:hypothetical protein